MGHAPRALGPLGRLVLFHRRRTPGTAPITLVVLRGGLAALILNLVAPMLGLKMPRDGWAWAAFLGMGLLNNAVPFCLIVWGQTRIASGLAAILNATTPLSAVVVAHCLTPDERMTANRLVGVLVGLAGVAVLVGPAVLMGLGTNVIAQGAVLAAALSYAFAGVFGRRFKRMGVPAIVTAAGQVTASTLVLLPVALLVDHPWTLAAPSLTVSPALA